MQGRKFVNHTHSGLSKYGCEFVSNMSHSFCNGMYGKKSFKVYTQVYMLYISVMNIYFIWLDHHTSFLKLLIIYLFFIYIDSFPYFA